MHAGTQRLDVVALLHGIDGTLDVIAHGEHRQQHVTAPGLHQVHLLLERTLAVIIEFGLQADEFILPLGQRRRQIRSRSGLVAAFGSVCHCVSSVLRVV